MWATRGLAVTGWLVICLCCWYEFGEWRRRVEIRRADAERAKSWPITAGEIIKRRQQRSGKIRVGLQPKAEPTHPSYGKSPATRAQEDADRINASMQGLIYSTTSRFKPSPQPSSPWYIEPMPRTWPCAPEPMKCVTPDCHGRTFVEHQGLRLCQTCWEKRHDQSPNRDYTGAGPPGELCSDGACTNIRWGTGKWGHLCAACVGKKLKAGVNVLNVGAKPT